MRFLQSILSFFDTSMPTPQPYGWFHILFFVLSFVAAMILCRFPKKQNENHVWRVVWITAVIVAIWEVYKQINFSFSYENGISFDYQWYAFPFQFCSTPMYVGLLVGLVPKGKVQDSLRAYLATYALFAGLSVMVYPNDVFIPTIGINLQTMICHGSMITIGIYLFYSGSVEMKHKTILKAIPVFAINVALAAIMNEIAYRSGLLQRETFNMFFISPYCDPSLPVYSLVQGAVPFPLCLIVYILGFTLAAYLMLLIAMGVSRVAKKVRKKEVVTA